jgi:ubiquinone/menaquinone biosynthesis C-methylase UbiE
LTCWQVITAANDDEKRKVRKVRKQTVNVSGVLIALVLSAGVAAQTPGVHPISGRRFAPVMGYQGAEWLERSERDQEEAPDIALAVLNIPKGASVADIGAGSGYMTEKLSARVGADGRVFANDVQPQMLDILARRLAIRKITNVTLVQGTIDDPKLPAASVDLELMVDVYHELSQPQTMLRHLRSALKPGGRLVLLEYRKEDPSIPIKPEHKMSVAEAKLEVEAEGFTLAKVDEALPRQHILIFTVKPAS